MKMLHFPMWIISAFVFTAMGALLAGKNDIEKQRSEAGIIMNLSLDSLAKINARDI